MCASENTVVRKQIIHFDRAWNEPVKSRFMIDHFNDLTFDAFLLQNDPKKIGWGTKVDWTNIDREGRLRLTKFLLTGGTKVDRALQGQVWV